MQLEEIPKAAVVSDDGQSYARFRSLLQPKRTVVVRDFTFGYLMLAITAALVIVSVESAPALRVVWVLAGSVLIGFWMAYIQLFLHEAAHFNLARDRRVNDYLANLLIGVWVATDIREYRRIHWDHHRFLGLPADTERSYFAALDSRFLFEGVFLVGAIRVILHRRGRIADKARGAGIRMFAATAIAHAAVVILCVWQRQFELAAAWLIGNLMILPLFGALRQLLEHRDANALRDLDYATVPHGKTTRSFKAGPFGTFFGGAGFRLHDLHHFDPELSYTNLPAVDEFLGNCSVARSVRDKSGSYASTAAILWRR